MIETSVRTMRTGEFKEIYSRIRRDFKSGEYAPYGILLQQLKKGVQQGLILRAGEQDAAYAVCAAGHENGYVLLSLMAVYEELRGEGLGTVFLGELKKIYADKNGIIIEVEKPETAAIPEEKVARQKRIGFYQKAGFHLVNGVNYAIWDVPMHLMVLPLQASYEVIVKDIRQIMYDIYLQLMGERYIHKMEIWQLKI